MEKLHLVVAGDTFCGASHFACGPVTEKNEKDKGLLILNEPSEILKVNCRNCQSSDAFRSFCIENKIEHPYTTRAKKAHASLKAKKERHERYLNNLAKDIANLHVSDIKIVLQKVDDLKGLSLAVDQSKWHYHKEQNSYHVACGLHIKNDSDHPCGLPYENYREFGLVELESRCPACDKLYRKEFPEGYAK